jgi:phage/conjugal plasmid C-4 type zinc finger TraR family protein
MSDLENFESNNEEEAEIAQILTLQRNTAAVDAIRAKIGKGPSLSHCGECGEEIPKARQQAIAGCKMCIECQEYSERWTR